jgi:hypothetical protein
MAHRGFDGRGILQGDRVALSASVRFDGPRQGEVVALLDDDRIRVRFPRMDDTYSGPSNSFRRVD